MCVHWRGEHAHGRAGKTTSSSTHTHKQRPRKQYVGLNGQKAATAMPEIRRGALSLRSGRRTRVHKQPGPHARTHARSDNLIFDWNFQTFVLACSAPETVVCTHSEPKP